MNPGTVRDRNSMLPSKFIAAALVCAWLVAAIPIGVTNVPPMVDYPGQLARVHLLANWNHLTGYDKFYRPAWEILPNLALDLVTVPLAKVFTANVAMHVFCVLVLGVLIGGGASLIRAVSGRWTAWAFAPTLLVYNHILAFGFVTFLFTFGVALFALALHVTGRHRPLLTRVVRELVCMFALFIGHFMVFVIYVVAAAAYDTLSMMAERRPRKELLREYIVLGACALLPVLIMPISPTRLEATSIEFSNVLWKLHKVELTVETGQGAWDYVFAIATLGAVASLIASGHLRVQRVMAGVAVVLCFMFAVSPYRIGYASNLDLRLPLVVLFVGAAALDTRSERTAPVLGTLLILFLVRVSTTTVHFYRSSAELERITADLPVIPPGVLVFTARDAGAPVWSASHWNPPLPHASELLLMKQPFFSATLFTFPTQQPLLRTKEFAYLNIPSDIGEASRTGLESYAARMSATLAAAGRTEPTYVYFLKGPEAPASTNRFEVVLDRPRFAIYRLVR